MRAFAEAYPDQEFVQQVVAQLPWGHQVRILDTLSFPSSLQFHEKRYHWYQSPALVGTNPRINA
jgi:hypothetical protein